MIREGGRRMENYQREVGGWRIITEGDRKMKNY